MTNGKTEERIDELEEDVKEIKEKIKPKKVKTYGDPIVKVYS